MFGGLWWIIGVIAAVWVIYDVWTKRGSMDQTQKIIWTIAAVIFSVITAIVYYFVVMRK
jgi:prolipoprotein diacylglyceryltransferase